ncbi:MAG: Lon protease [Candidatus Roseilinea sp.]|nr:MAG: Lon protease [Candidatus Roseilinea sp.]
MRESMQRNPLDLLLLDHLLEEMADENKPTDAPAQEQQSDTGRSESLGVLPILPLRGVLVYPLSALPLRVSQPRSIRLIDDVTLRKMPIGLVASKHPEKDEPGPEDIFTVGTIATIARHFKAPDGVVNMIVQGAERFRIVEIVSEDPYIVAKVEPLPETWENSLEIEALRRNISEGFNKMAELRPDMPDELAQMIQSIEDPRQLTYAVATYTRIDLDDAQRLLEMDGLPNKMLFLLQLLNKELEVLQLGKKIQSEAQSEMEKVQREYFLREQIKAIQRELGEADEQQIEINAFREKIAASGMNEEARKEAERELDRMAKMPTQSAEYSVIRTYLDWMVSLPWQKTTQDNLDIAHARQVLDEDHYGLQDIKERILEFLAVRKRRQELQAASAQLQAEAQPAHLQPEADWIRREREGVILCFVGPPGVGKTSLGASIARAMGRKFIRMSVGGIRDEAEIRGFRRTYIGSMPGRIIQSIRRVESRNPVFMLDEVDKMGSDFRGDPSSALLEVLDPEQNREFRDHYLDVPFDLSQTMFICTANTLETIPGPLRDRMEILQLSGYTESEKLHIAQGYLVPRQLKENGLRPGEVTFSDEAILKLMREYTREAGVRNLEREIGNICRKLVARAQEGKVTLPFHVTPESLPDLRGKAKFYNEVAERTEIPGVATGMSWTPVGGEIIFIEATRMPGSKGFQLTGQLGDVMKESAQAALSYVRSHAGDLKIDPKIFDKSDIHIHVPAGAQPKDGPSAGVTIATALASLFTGRKVRHDVAMTGEITLRGSVLPVGGIKEKVLAAHRAGLKTIILPKRNEPDLEDLPPEVRDALQFVLVDRVEQALAAALMPAKRGREQSNGQVQSRESRTKSQGAKTKN